MNLLEQARRRWWGSPTRRRWLLAVAVYCVAVAGFALAAAPQVFSSHTRYNHFALLADGFLEGRLDLGGPPPAYAGRNDFALYDGKWFVVFPPFPALLVLPFVWLAGGAGRFADGAYFLLLAGVAPALLFLVFEKLRRMGFSPYGQRAHLLLSLLFAFGSVYFFTAVQGSVWYAAHVVGAASLAAYVLFALGAERPFAAGTALAFGLLTRAPLIGAAPLFFLELRRAALAGGEERSRGWIYGSVARFALPLALAVGAALWLDWARFGDPLEPGYRYLTIRWRERIDTWGLFSFHYLGRNLAVVLTSLPWPSAPGQATPFQINGHGLALWVTTPLYLWLLWPRRTPQLFWSLVISAALVAIPTLFYQNTGWVQFGYRFSNDYAVLLFALFAVGGYELGRWFRGAALVSVAVNAFGAFTFNRPGYDEYYFVEPSQRILHQPD